jgi:hypothetical protein
MVTRKLKRNDQGHYTRHAPSLETTSAF